ncbi:MAG: hypothetical protein FWF81_11990 [Defluviitaleaceae bacterium]|nr:hypothetical protein [Defluviitaleaceae bacterium]
MDREMEYIATVYFEPITFSVYNCSTLEDAEKSANESAADLATCMGLGASVSLVEVMEAK